MPRIGKKTAASLAVLTAAGLVLAYALSHPSLDPYAQLQASEVTPKPKLNVRPQASEVKPSLDADVTARFLGTGTVSLDDGETAIMTDGFFSRPSLPRVLFGKLAPDDARIDAALRQADIQRLAAIFVAHSHYDHAMDSPAVALKTGAVVLGSESTANVSRGAGLPADRIRVFKDGDRFDFGRFRVTVFETPHSPGAMFPGVIAGPLRPSARASEYKLGGNYSFLVEHDARRILIVVSTNYTPGKLKGVKADVVFLGIATLGKQGPDFVEGYWREVVQTTGATLVIPVHWDDFTRPLDEPLVPLPRGSDDFSRSMKVLGELARRDGVTLRLPTKFATIDLDQREPGGR